jgi:hypothetical protein
MSSPISGNKSVEQGYKREPETEAILKELDQMINELAIEKKSDRKEKRKAGEFKGVAKAPSGEYGSAPLNSRQRAASGEYSPMPTNKKAEVYDKFVKFVNLSNDQERIKIASLFMRTNLPVVSEKGQHRIKVLQEIFKDMKDPEKIDAARKLTEKLLADTKNVNYEKNANPQELNNFKAILGYLKKYFDERIK